MSHPLETVINQADGFLLIGDSANDRFPGFSYASYHNSGKRFYCLDMGGLTESRGPVKGEKVYTSVAELPEDRDDLAIIWVKPGQSIAAVELAREAGCKRVWFSFKTAHRDAVAKARDYGMEVIEVGRCPVYYVDGKSFGCKLHAAAVKVSGVYAQPPHTEVDEGRREIL